MTTEEQRVYLADVKFNVEQREIKFQVIHNLPEIHGLSFMDAFNSWLARTNNFSAQSLCKYVMSKDKSFVCLTKKQWEKRK